MSIKKKIITGTVLGLTIFNIGTAQAIVPNNMDFSLKPSLSFISNGGDFLNKKTKNSLGNNYNSFQNIFEKEETNSPLGFQIFCLQNKMECKVSSQSTTDYNFRFMKKLNKINKDVNLAITPQNDIGLDKWSINVSVGDCEDYVLTKRSLLIKSGIAAGALRIATATTKEGVGHAVLIVRTTKGDFVLDNLTNAILPWNRVEHSLLAISGSDPHNWSIIR